MAFKKKKNYFAPKRRPENQKGEIQQKKKQR